MLEWLFEHGGDPPPAANLPGVSSATPTERNNKEVGSAVRSAEPFVS